METGWIFLIAACILEPLWVIALEKSNGFKKPVWTAASLAGVLLCLYCMAIAVVDLRPGMAFALLAGIGTIGALIAGAFIYKEKVTAKKIFFTALILVGVIGIRLVQSGVI